MPRLGSALLAVAAFFLVLIPQARADLRMATLRHDSMVYRQANEISPILGKLREGKSVKVYYPDRNGWYAVSFAQPIQGARYGWVHAEDVDVGDAGGGAASGGNNSGSSSGGTSYGSSSGSRGPGFRLKKNWLDIGIDLRSTSPSNFQETIGEPTAGFYAKGFSLEYGRRFNPKVGLALRGFYYSWTSPNTRVDSASKVVVDGNYGASGYGLTAGIDFTAVNVSGFLLSFGAGLGVSLNQAQNSSPTDGFLTTNIVAIPIYGEMNARKFFGAGPLGLGFGVGYQAMTLSEVPVLLPNNAADPGSANVNVGGLYFHGAICLQL